MRPGRSTSRALRAPCRQPGVALVAVLWMVAALSLLATALAADTRAQLRGAQVARAFAEAAALGDAAIQLAALDMSSGAPPVTRLTRRAYRLDADVIEVEIVPASGFVDLNDASEPLLHDLFRYGAGLDESAADTLAQRLIDWQDPDPAALPLGAEDEDYAEAGVPYRTRGGPLETTEDLLQVLGVDFDVYDRLRDLVTVYSGAAGVDPLAAPPAVLQVLAGGNAEAAARIAAARDAGEPLIDTTALVQAHLVAASGLVYRLEARVRTSGGLILARGRWVDLGARGAAGQPWRTLRIEPVHGVRAGA